MLNNKINVPRPVELAIIHNCNLACEGCSHFSDYGHNWRIKLEEVDEWLAPWSKIINPQFFSVLGGEPTLHKDLCEILRRCRKYFTGRFLFTTNAFFLHKHPDLEQVLFDCNIELKIGIHGNDEAYLQQVGENINTVKHWQRKGLKILWAELHSEGWRKSYHGHGENMMPFEDNNPRSSWENCPCRCYQIVEKEIWKCPQIAYLHLQKKKYNLKMEWYRYLEWKPLKLKSSFREKVEFFQREAEFICGMCPSRINYIQRTTPLRGK